MSQAQCSSPEPEGQREGGSASPAQPCLREQDPGPRGFLSEAKTSLAPEGSPRAAHGRGFRSNPRCLARQEGKQAGLEAAPVLPRGPGVTEHGAARRFLFFRGQSQL